MAETVPVPASLRLTFVPYDEPIVTETRALDGSWRTVTDRGFLKIEWDSPTGLFTVVRSQTEELRAEEYDQLRPAYAETVADAYASYVAADDDPYVPSAPEHVSKDDPIIFGRRWKAERDAAREALSRFADWLERDRREPDKVLCVVQSMRRAAREEQPEFPTEERA